jgi:hypothetical protein
LACHSDIGTKEGVQSVTVLSKEMVLEESKLNQDDTRRLWEAFVGRAIDKFLNRL